MENKGLLKLPETWHVIVKKDNQIILSRWITEASHNDSLIDIGCIVGISCYEYKRAWNPATKTQRFGQEITFADFKRLVLGEKNYCDYGVVGCEQLSEYFNKNKVTDLFGDFDNIIYFFKNEKWNSIAMFETKRQTLPLQEYLTLIEPENMEKKYEYKLRDEKYIEPILKLTDRKIDFTFPLREEIVPNTITILRDLNVLDLFFEKVEVKELPIIGGKEIYVNEQDNTIQIDGVLFDISVIYNLDYFSVNNNHVSKEYVKQIREYLRKK